MNYNNSNSGRADRPGVREWLVEALAEAEYNVEVAENLDEFEDWVAAANDAAMRLREFDEVEAEAEYCLDQHRLLVAEAGTNIDPADVHDENEKLTVFCALSQVVGWEFLAGLPGFEIGERLVMQKHRHDQLEKAELSFLESVTGEPVPTWPYGFETEVMKMPIWTGGTE